MTTKEFKLEFDLLYNNILGEGAPGLDDYEVSVYLTIAQEELVKSYYTGKNFEKTSFEQTEARRRALDELVTPYSTAIEIASTNGLSSDSKMFELPKGVMYIVYEQVELSKSGSIIDGTIAEVKPTTYDEYAKANKNPFRKANHRRVLRLDLKKENSKTTVELISPEIIKNYRIRYVAYPSPIIINNLDEEDFEGLDLSINGDTKIAESKLNPYLHREIINRATELAVRDYRENSLETRIKTNSRV